jgi:hypothetical protein
MIDVKSKISQILSESQIEQLDEGLLDILKNIFSSKEKIKPFKDENELLAAFEAHNFPQIIASNKFLEIFQNAYPQKIFIDYDEAGVYLGAYFSADKMIINIGSDFSGSVRTEVFPFTKPPAPKPKNKTPAAGGTKPATNTMPTGGIDTRPRI